ncbi:hypothetical protein H632_c4931p0, partial [Helicosporidium sp. ATCC 50920]
MSQPLASEELTPRAQTPSGSGRSMGLHRSSTVSLSHAARGISPSPFAGGSQEEEGEGPEDERDSSSRPQASPSPGLSFPQPSPRVSFSSPRPSKPGQASPLPLTPETQEHSLSPAASPSPEQEAALAERLVALCGDEACVRQ